MSSKKKSKNRRFERENVLDVKLRSQHVRAVRLKWVATAFGVLVGALLVLLTLSRGSEWLLDIAVFKNPSFNIRQVTVETDGIIPVAQIRAWSGVRSGDNLLGLDLIKVKRDLELVPAIENAEVERVLPDTLRIRVMEREPIAQASMIQIGPSGQAESVTLLLDRAGYVFQPFDPASGVVSPADSNFNHLPVLYGIPATELKPGCRLEMPRAHAALQLIKAFVRSPMAAAVDIKSFELSEPGIVKAHTDEANEITFALDGLEGQLRRWRAVHEFAQRENRAIATLDLSVSNNVPATWQEASYVPSVRPKTTKPSRYRKKHV